MILASTENRQKNFSKIPSNVVSDTVVMEKINSVSGLKTVSNVDALAASNGQQQICVESLTQSLTLVDT